MRSEACRDIQNLKINNLGNPLQHIAPALAAITARRRRPPRRIESRPCRPPRQRALFAIGSGLRWKPKSNRLIEHENVPHRHRHRPRTLSLRPHHLPRQPWHPHPPIPPQQLPQDFYNCPLPTNTPTPPSASPAPARSTTTSPPPKKTAKPSSSNSTTEPRGQKQDAAGVFGRNSP